jgi:hypothetical protein
MELPYLVTLFVLLVFHVYKALNNLYQALGKEEKEELGSLVRKTTATTTTKNQIMQSDSYHCIDRLRGCGSIEEQHDK